MLFSQWQTFGVCYNLPASIFYAQKSVCLK
jgi:hypothetical protein